MLDLIDVSYDTQIPNNVGLSSDKKSAKGAGKMAPRLFGLVEPFDPPEFPRIHGVFAYCGFCGSKGLGQI